MAGSIYDGIKHTVHLSTNIGKACEHCSESVGGASLDIPKLAESINHYIEKHGYRLLHVGTETTEDDRGNPHQTTVAVVGK